MVSHDRLKPRKSRTLDGSDAAIDDYAPKPGDLATTGNFIVVMHPSHFSGDARSVVTAGGFAGLLTRGFYGAMFVVQQADGTLISLPLYGWACGVVAGTDLLIKHGYDDDPDEAFDDFDYYDLDYDHAHCNDELGDGFKDECDEDLSCGTQSLLDLLDADPDEEIEIVFPDCSLDEIPETDQPVDSAVEPPPF